MNIRIILLLITSFFYTNIETRLRTIPTRKLINAGILPYAYHPNGTAYFLIGQEPNGLWADFGGNYEQTDPNPCYTAAREFSEETRYVFGKFAARHKSLTAKVNRGYLKKSIDYIMPRITKELTHPKGYYKMFLAQVDFIPAHLFTQAATVPHYEKKEYAWVPAQEFMDAMRQTTDRWHAFYKNKQMRRQIHDILHREYRTIIKTIVPKSKKHQRLVIK